MNLHRATLGLLFVWSAAFAGPGEEEAVDLLAASPNFAVSAAWNREAALPGEMLVLAVTLDVPDRLHVNSDAAQQRPMEDFFPYPTSLRVVDASDALTIESVRFPRAHAVRAEYVEGDLMAFTGKTTFFLPMRVEERVAGDALFVALEIEYQACDDVQCWMPQTDSLRAVIPVAAPGTPVKAVREDLFSGLDAARSGEGRTVGFDLFTWSFSVDAGSSDGLVLLLLVAMAGGFLLNLTPCVLPVIPIKIMSLSNAAGSRSRCLALGATMSFGVVGFWLTLGIVISSVTGFTATNQLFQYPAFSITVGLVIAFMAVAMTGALFLRLPQGIYRWNPSQESLHGSFGLGIMTAILSTPCTAPFMGAAAAWAATQPATTTLGTFTAIGAGMALPYFLLSAFPGLVRRVPRTGPGSELLKQVMGLLMLAAGAYFLGVGVSALLVESPDPPSRIHWWFVMGFVAAAGVWLAYRTIRITAKPLKRLVFASIGVTVVGMAVLGGLDLTEKGPIAWVYYTPDRFRSALADGKVVVMDFTAEWCLNCKSLEHGVLHTESVAAALALPDVVPIKVDITGNNPDGKARLREAGRLTIPLLVIYSSSGEEVFKADFYTAEEVLEAVERARSRGRLATAS